MSWKGFPEAQISTGNLDWNLISEWNSIWRTMSEVTLSNIQKIVLEIVITDKSGFQTKLEDTAWSITDILVERARKKRSGPRMQPFPDERKGKWKNFIKPSGILLLFQHCDLWHLCWKSCKWQHQRFITHVSSFSATILAETYSGIFCTSVQMPSKFVYESTALVSLPKSLQMT